MDLTLADAHDRLAQVGATAIPVAEWDDGLARAVQRSLAELFLLNPDDDVDGQPGRRTKGALSLFRAGVGLAAADGIDATAARALIQHSGDRAAFIGTPKVQIQPDFSFRRGQNAANRQASAEALIAAAKAADYTRPQIAYLLATAEHESAGFQTLEEFDSGQKYEGRKDLGNTEPGDGPRFKGRGYVQLTGRNNYRSYANRTGIKLVDLPVIPMNWAAFSVYVIVDGMQRGAYTGKRLDQFVNATKQDFRNARRVVNGVDQADRIAGLAETWLAKLS